MDVLDKLQKFVDESNSSNSSNDKLEVIRNWKDDNDIMQLLKLVYNPLIKFEVTSKGCKKKAHLDNRAHDSIFDLLEDLYRGGYKGRSCDLVR